MRRSGWLDAYHPGRRRESFAGRMTQRGVTGYRARVRFEQFRGGTRSPPTPVVDVAVAAGLAIVIAILIAARQESGAKDPDALAFLLGVAIAASLLVRRWPLAVFLVSVLLLMAYHALDY